jgi:hypothetical protein
MKAAPLLVSWHNENAPIYSAHFEPQGKGRLATAGGDNNVRVGRREVVETLQWVTDGRIALESRGSRRGTQGHVSVHARKALTSRECGPLEPARYAMLHRNAAPYMPALALTVDRRDTRQRRRRWQRAALGSCREPCPPLQPGRWPGRQGDVAGEDHVSVYRV